MKLLDRVRIPLTEKVMPPAANELLPLDSWDTPATCNAIPRMLPFGARGISVIRLDSKLTPTSALVTLISGALLVISMVSDMEETFKVTSILGRSFNKSVIGP